MTTPSGSERCSSVEGLLRACGTEVLQLRVWLPSPASGLVPDDSLRRIGNAQQVASGWSRISVESVLNGDMGDIAPGHVRGIAY